MARRGVKRKAATSTSAKNGAGGGSAAVEDAGGVDAEVVPREAKKKASEPIFKAPDAAEVLDIAQTRNLFKSNLFRLQLEELLKGLAPPKATPRLEAFLRILQPLLCGLHPVEIRADFQAEFPQLHFHQRQPQKFSFKPPKRIDVVGSFLVGTCFRPHLCVDVAVEIPSEILAPKDHLNFRYLDKRAAYAGEVYRQLKRQQAAQGADELLQGAELHFEGLQGDPYRPCVVLRPGGKLEAREGAWTVRLLPTCAPSFFVAGRLAPDRNAIRPTLAGERDEEAVPAAAVPTSHYNSCILEDARMRAHVEVLYGAVQRVPPLKEAILLLKKWAASHGLMPEEGRLSVFVPLGGFCLSMVAAHAVLTENMSASQISPFQLFKIALAVLASTDWESQKLIFGTAAPAPLSAAELGTGCRAHFYDSDRLLNFFWRLGPFIREIRYAAQRTLHCLDAEADPYEAAFGQSGSSPALLWDLVLRTPPLPVGAIAPELHSGAESGVAAPDKPFGGPRSYDIPKALGLCTDLADALAVGLGDRCLRRPSARLVGSPFVRWGDQRPADSDTAVTVMVGLLLDAMLLDRTLDKGPAAQESTAAVSDFRKFWGAEKTELRRFKDGSILECAVWTKPPHSQATAARRVESRKSPAVVTQITRHVLSRHFEEIAEQTDLIAGPVGFLPNLGDRGKQLWLSLQRLRTHLCQLSSMPLTVKDVHPADAGFLYSDIFVRDAPPAPDGVARTLHDVVLEFESSGRWPEDPEAARKVCAALMLQMREELQTDLGIEAGITEDYLDVRYPEFVFRVRVFHQHELMATAHRVTNFQAQRGGPPPEAAALERLRQLWWRPRLVNSLHGHILQRPAMAGASRLCQQWMASQMLSGYEDFVEHLVAAVFLHPSPLEAPSSAQVGFCRVLRLLDSFDWGHEPLVIDFDEKLSDEERLSMRRSFEDSRGESPDVLSFGICSRFDPHAWLLVTPPATVGLWLQRRARHALDACQQRLLGLRPSQGWRPLFALDPSVFDVVIQLKAPGEDLAAAAGRSTAKRNTSLVARRRRLAMQEASSTVVEKLRLHLSTVCLLFHDQQSHRVALKWRPGAFFPQHQNVLMGPVPHTMLPRGRDEPPLCVPNVLCLAAFISSLAEGLVADVTLVGAES